MGSGVGMEMGCACLRGEGVWREWWRELEEGMVEGVGWWRDLDRRLRGGRVCVVRCGGVISCVEKAM